MHRCTSWRFCYTNPTGTNPSYRPPFRFPPFPPPFPPPPAPASVLPCVPSPVVSFGACFLRLPELLFACNEAWYDARCFSGSHRSGCYSTEMSARLAATEVANDDSRLLQTSDPAQHPWATCVAAWTPSHWQPLLYPCPWHPKRSC